MEAALPMNGFDPSDGLASGSRLIWRVPDGKRLVVEYVWWRAVLDNSYTTRVLFRADDSTEPIIPDDLSEANVFLAPVRTFGNAPGQVWEHNAAFVHFTAQAGQGVFAFADVKNNGDPANVDGQHDVWAGFSGYLVDLP
jgi:hypothetical protein